ncbi:MAG: glycosyl hydrolase family 18 protein [Lentimicrobium sp.]
MVRQAFVLYLIMINTWVFAQHPSIHEEQSAYYKTIGLQSQARYDSISDFAGRSPFIGAALDLQKRVFGYHPYWMGNSWQNYRWELLSDLCYFSYDTDPATGNPLTTNGFETAEVIDTALAHGVRVHLCVTLFSGHAAFFANPQAQQNLTGNIISLIVQRGIQGVNIDFEAVPSSQQQGLTNYLVQLSQELHSVVPGAELSIAAPAVNWSNTFDIPAIAPALDFIMIMAYDYYWNGSSLAGPVSGYWPLTSSFNYAVDHSLSYYQSQGVPNEKLLLGLPYYGREWPVTSNTLPAGTSGSGTAVTYSNVRGNSSGFYTPQNLYWDQFSFNPYYSYLSNSWRQCFFDDVRSLGAKYDLVNRRNAGGIGIWALGYDNGYPELWDLIAEKFAQTPAFPCRDTLYDPGGPWWNYGDDESYMETISSDYPGPLSLHFEQFSLETGFDSLWIYDGLDVNAPLLAALSGNQTPAGLFTSGNGFTIRFYSDGATTRAGYSLVWSCPTASINEIIAREFSIYPNPADDRMIVTRKDDIPDAWSVELFDIQGKSVRQVNSDKNEEIVIHVRDFRNGIYILKVKSGSYLNSFKVVICH